MYNLSSDNLLPVNTQNLSRAWLKLSIVSLIAAGCFSLLLVFSRTPGIQDMIPWLDFFHTALVIHVNLSVVFWFLNFACLFWSLYSHGHSRIAEYLAFALCSTGTVLIVLAAFVSSDARPLINNYIPVLQTGWFYTGLGLFGLGLLIQILRAVILLPWPRTRSGFGGIFAVATWSSALTCLIAILTLAWSWQHLDSGLESTSYFEFLFWSSGHVVQFSHTILMLLTWVLLCFYTGRHLGASEQTLRHLFWILLIPLPIALWIVLQFPVISLEHREYFTDLMKYGGLLSLPLGVLVVLSVLFQPADNAGAKAANAALWSSIMLFLAGGIIGFLIQGINVVIPAHYHGSIVGVTLAFMGLTYYLLPRLGYRNPTWKLAIIQPWLLFAGQMMHVLGLAWSGGYGVQRKTAGVAQGLDALPQKLGMILMGTGGGIAAIGGLLFLIVIIKSMMRQQKY